MLSQRHRGFSKVGRWVFRGTESGLRCNEKDIKVSALETYRENDLTYREECLKNAYIGMSHRHVLLPQIGRNASET